MVKMSTRMLCVAVFVATSVVLAWAADVTDAVNKAEGRKRAAESGMRSILAKSPTEAGQVKGLYTDAAAAHNAWLDATTTAVGQGAMSDAVSTTAATAASALVQWVAARNQLLGEPVLAGDMAAMVDRATRQDLIDIATETALKTRGADARKRTAAADALSSRLRWKTWTEIQS